MVITFSYGKLLRCLSCIHEYYLHCPSIIDYDTVFFKKFGVFDFGFDSCRLVVAGMASKKQSKLKWMKLGYKQKNASPIADLLAFRKVKARLGGRLRLIVSGSAPLSTEVEEFMRVTSYAFVVQGYGFTETCGLASLGFPDEMCMIGTVGPPFVYSELRLEEVPDMGYNPLADPPRGEIFVRAESKFSGYYKNPELTREAVRDGWFHTGVINTHSEVRLGGINVIVGNMQKYMSCRGACLASIGAD